MRNTAQGFRDRFADAQASIIILGTNPLIPFLESSAQFFADLLTLRTKLRLSILYESDSENFSQSLCVDTQHSENRFSYESLRVHRNRISGTKKEGEGGIFLEIGECLSDDMLRKAVLRRVTLRQVNLRLPLNIISVDSRLWFCVVTNSMPVIEDYIEIKKNDPLYLVVTDFLDFYTDQGKGGIYLSQPKEELIQLYDKEAYPRGIFPRACFYTTEFQRFSIWGFIFNRRGKLLLHKRSMATKDGRGLWDKSVGGHVDLLDSSTFITAQRELVEELFLPEAEYSKHVRADLGDIINFGDWNPTKRPERVFKNAFAGLGAADWIQFRATDGKGEPLTVTRVSNRRIHRDDGSVRIKKTVFRSDVYLFIAPPEYLDTDEQMRRLLEIAEQKGAASDHRLISVGDFRKWIDDTEKEGKSDEIFTDDLLFINVSHRNLLEQFAEFVTFMF